MKLFGGHPDLKEPEKLRATLDEALAQQPSILVAYLQQTIALLSDGSRALEAGATVVMCLQALLDYLDKTAGALIKFKSDVTVAVSAVLDVSTRHYDHVFEGCLKVTVV